MKRSSFKRAEYVRKPRAPLVPPAEPVRAVMARPALMFEPQPKTVPVRSKPLREAYRLIPCKWPGCGIDDGTVCCAHSNFHEHGGKAGARKADDTAGASLCFKHHRALDQGSALSYEEKKAGWLSAHESTMAALIVKSQETGSEAQRLRKLLQQHGIVR